MNEETKALLTKFQEITGVKPRSARLETGSMREFVCFKMDFSEEIKNFCSTESFYKQGNKVFHGVKITYLGNILDDNFHEKRGYQFFVKKEDLT